MSLPADASKTNCDATTDDPKLALTVDLAGVIDKFNTLLAHLGASPITSGDATGALRVGTGLADDGAGKLKVDGSVVALLGAAAAFTKQTRGTEAALPATSGTVTLDLATSNNFGGTLAGNITLANPTNPGVGQSGAIRLQQDATGGRTITFGANWKTSGGSAATLTATASATDVIFYYVVNSTFVLYTIQKDVK